jgi:hypothetical protein
MKVLTLAFDWQFEARNQCLTFLSSMTLTSKVKYFFKYFIKRTKNGIVTPNVCLGFEGKVENKYLHLHQFI